MDETDYRLLIERLARERTGETVLNGSFSHASVINECMFRNSSSAISVLTRRLAPDVFGTDQFISAFGESGEKGTKVTILVEEASSEYLAEHPLAQALRNHPCVMIRRLSAKHADDVEVNYTIMDGDSYRFERDKRKAVAVASFGGSQSFCGRLKNHFDFYWSESEPISIQ